MVSPTSYDVMVWSCGELSAVVTMVGSPIVGRSRGDKAVNHLCVDEAGRLLHLEGRESIPARRQEIARSKSEVSKESILRGDSVGEVVAVVKARHPSDGIGHTARCITIPRGHQGPLSTWGAFTKFWTRDNIGGCIKLCGPHRNLATLR